MENSGKSLPHSSNLVGFLMGRVELDKSEGSCRAQWETLAEAFLRRRRRTKATGRHWGREEMLHRYPVHSGRLTAFHSGSAEVLPRRSHHSKASPSCIDSSTRREPRWAHAPLKWPREGKQEQSSGCGRNIKQRSSLRNGLCSCAPPFPLREPPHRTKK